MRRKVQIEFNFKGLTPEEVVLVHLVIKPVLDDVMEFLELEEGGENE